MQRRQFLHGAAAAAGLAGPAAPSRRRPDDPGWPDAAAWGGLAERVGGALLRPADPWSACRQADPQACRAAFARLRNPYFLSEQAGAAQLFGWLDGWTATPSAYAIAARSAAEVAAGVDFARDHALRLVVKGGGHSYLGGSTAADSLLIWTHPMRGIALHDDFSPQGTGWPGQPAVSVQAGALWIDVYDAVTTRAGRYVQGGGCATVGVAGLVLGGGFGSFSKRYGIAAASLLEAEIVTADGRTRVVNAARDSDLFWALRGGGGSFGVVTRLTLRTHELPVLFGAVGAAIKAVSDAAFRALLERFVAFCAGQLCSPAWGEQVAVRPDNVLAIDLVCQGLDGDAIGRIWRPLWAWVEARQAEYRFVARPRSAVRPARGWWDMQARRAEDSAAVIFDDRPGAAPGHAWWAGDGEQAGAFLHGYDSVWLPETLLAPAAGARLAEAVFAASREVAVGLHLNKGLAGAPAEVRAAARETAMHPGVADAFALAIVAAGGPPPLPGLADPAAAAPRRNAAQVARAAAVLRALAPGSGGYLSESSYFNPDWRQEFWGPQADRLWQVKDRYDPDGLFYVHHGVGSERWQDGGFVRMR